MGNNEITGNENIHVKVDHNNLIFIDPNSVVNNGIIEPRGIKQENLMMYVNLEADLIPRTIMVTDTLKNTKSTVVSIAKGTLNFLKNAGGRDYDTTWTDAYTETYPAFETNADGTKTPITKQYDKSGQSFGIESINIAVKGANFIPQITINFTDVRGKTLFESPENSPYSAFFHLPWPIFYLTVKGYYGKAIKYRLHLTKFTSKYNESNGNFDVTTSFVGSTYAYLNDIPLNGILNAPYMYANEIDKPAKFNSQTGIYTKSISKSTKGYATLKTVYDEYKQKGLLPKDFPVKTLRELIVVAKSLDKILERTIFDQVVDAKIFGGIRDFEKILTDFEEGVKSWAKINLSNETYTDQTTNQVYQYLAGDASQRVSLDKITNPDNNGTLSRILIECVKNLKNSKLVIEKYKNNTSVSFKKETYQFINTIKDITQYYNKLSNGVIVVNLQKLLYDIHILQNTFVKQRNAFEDLIEKKMNEVISDSSKGGIGFEPTIRNIFAVILANADTYIRLLKDVHYRAFDAGNERKTLLQGFNDETRGEPIYPWPEIKKSVASTKQKVMAYPGDPDLQQKLQSYRKNLWPEVDFVEQFQSISTKRSDPMAQKEGGVGNINYVFDGDSSEKDDIKMSTAFSLTIEQSYSNKTAPAVIYEIYERAKFITLMETYGNTTSNSDNVLEELAKNEFEVISKVLKPDIDLIDFINKITSRQILEDYLLSFSPYERYPYYMDGVPTTSYIKALEESAFSMDAVKDVTNKKSVEDKFTSLSEKLKSAYVSPDYVKYQYPYNSDTYKNVYLSGATVSNNLSGIYKIDTLQGFVTSYFEPESWIKKEIYKVNGMLFDNKIKISPTSSEYILNTPYFHKQLFSDFTKTNSSGKYAGSAYLLLNSLPYKDLDDDITLNGKTVKMYQLFKDVNATHYIPYHLILKWGSLYHRYQTYLNEGYDILTGFTQSNTNTITTPIDGKLFFDANASNSFNVGGVTGITYTNYTDVGLHPFYENVFHQVVNDYSFYNPTTSTTLTYAEAAGIYKTRYRKSTGNENRFWTSYVDNSKFNDGDNFYTIMPCDGSNTVYNLNPTTTQTFADKEQNNFRCIWIDDAAQTDTYSGKTYFTYGQYNRTVENQYSLTSTNKKLYDLIATFPPEVLNYFENCFLEFSSENLMVEIERKLIPDWVSSNNQKHSIKYGNFQKLLKDIVTVKKEASDSVDVIGAIRQKQLVNLINISTDMLSFDNMVKVTFGNAKEINNRVWGGFTGYYEYSTFATDRYTTPSQFDLDTIKLYVGEEPVTNCYLNFFIDNNIKITPDNVKTLRPLILMYAGLTKNGNINSSGTFKDYIKNNILGPANNRLNSYLRTLTLKIGTLKPDIGNEQLSIVNGYNDVPLKLEQYQYFKSFNDKWVAGNSLGSRLLLEEFLFLDKANREVGSKIYIGLDKLISLENPKNDNVDLYSVISMLIDGTGFDMRGLPAYVNFYGAEAPNKSKPAPSKKVATNLFGTFLDVDYQESSPKILLQYIGPTSKHLELQDVNPNSTFKNDSFNIGDPNNNPMVITAPDVFDNVELYKSNKVVAFEVSVGDQNQGIFKSVELNQTSIRNTTESFGVMENLGRSESGAGVYQIDIGLFDIYRQSSYSCTVKCMGNVMIQPTMYFYLKNVPMFRGSYWITEVSHAISNNNINTTFTGTRIPYASLPDPKDSFLSSYRALFDKITKAAIAKITADSLIITGDTKNEHEYTIGNQTVTLDMGDANRAIKGEKLVSEMGVTEYGVPFNGYGSEKYIQKVTYNGKQWLRAQAVTMGGSLYSIDDSMTMDLFNNSKNKNLRSPIKWSEMKVIQDASLFYSTHFQLDVQNADFIMGDNTQPGVKYTTFLNPNIKGAKEVPLVHNYNTGNTPVVNGPVNSGPNLQYYAIGLSKALMKVLGLYEGQVLYFWVGPR